MSARTMIAGCCGLLIVTLALFPHRTELTSHLAWGQTKPSKSGTSRGTRKKDDKTSEKAIDSRAEEIQSGFIRDSVELAKEYEEAGLLDKSKFVLETLMKVNGDLPGIKEKIKSLDEELLTANDIDVDVDVEKGWGNAIGRVTKDQPIRFQVSGTYKFSISYTLDATGLNQNDPINGLAEGIPCGALIGMVVTKDQKTNVFPIGTGQDVTPKEDGILFLKVNLPKGHKSSGKLKVKISGGISNE